MIGRLVVATKGEVPVSGVCIHRGGVTFLSIIHRGASRRGTTVRACREWSLIGDFVSDGVLNTPHLETVALQ